MNLKQPIQQFIIQNKKIADIISNRISNYNDADQELPELLAAIKRSRYNPAFGTYLATILQLLNDKKAVKSFSLIDIREFFTSLIQVQEYEIDNYVEAAHFEWSVMNDKKRAKKLIKTGIKKAKTKAKELNKILKSIDKGK